MMTDSFKAIKVDVKTEQDKGVDVRVLKQSDAGSPKVQTFDMKKIETLIPKVAPTRAKVGGKESADSALSAKRRRDNRFALNPLQKDPLSIAEEEARLIEEQVKQRVAAYAVEVRTKAHEQGYQDGKKKGYDEAYSDFQKVGAVNMERFESLLAEFEGARADIFKANEKTIIDLVFYVAKMVLLQELKTDREYLVRLVSALIERIGVRENVKVHISPDDVQTIGMIKEGVEKAFGSLKNLNIEVDSQVKQGGCVVETEYNAIDAAIDAQLEGIRSALQTSESGRAT